MADYSNREVRKEQIRRRMVEGDAEYYDSYEEDLYDEEDRERGLERQRRRSRRIRRAVTIGILLAAVLLAAAAFLLHRYYRYSTFELSWEKILNEGSFAGCERYGENVLKYSHDGASYIDASGREIWVDSYEMKSPRAYISGDCACIYDSAGNQINIYNLAGRTGTAGTVLPVTKAVVAENGVCAAIVEDADASYISFFRKTGEELDITVKSRLSGDGYPIDIGLSPEGTQLIVSFAYLSDGQLKSKVIFYDFSEIGKNIPNRLVGGFEAPFDGSLVARVRFINSTYSYAAADTGIYIFSSKNIASPELVRELRTEELIQTLFNYKNGVGLILRSDEGEDPYRLVLYKADGSTALDVPVGFQYKYAGSDGQYIYFTDDDNFAVMNMHGVVKFNGYMTDAARVVTHGKMPGSFVFSGSSYVREYRFR